MSTVWPSTSSSPTDRMIAFMAGLCIGGRRSHHGGAENTEKKEEWTWPLKWPRLRLRAGRHPREFEERSRRSAGRGHRVGQLGAQAGDDGGKSAALRVGQLGAAEADPVKKPGQPLYRVVSIGRKE